MKRIKIYGKVNFNQTGFSLVLGVIILVVASGLIVFSLVQIERTRSNERYFSKLNSQTQNYYKQQLSALGVDARPSGFTKECYQSEQGPWDNGSLRCSIDANRRLTFTHGKLSMQLKNFINTVENQGFTTTRNLPTGNGLDGFHYSARKEGASSITEICLISLNYEPDGFVAGVQDKLVYEISCSNRASDIPKGFSQPSQAQ